MGQRSFLVAFAVSVVVGFIPIAARLSTSMSRSPVRRPGGGRRSGARVGAPAVAVAVADERWARRRVRNMSDLRYPNRAGAPGVVRRVEQGREARWCNLLGDRGQGYVI
jgi:hypothetical protein